MKYEKILAWWKKEKKETQDELFKLLGCFIVEFAYHSCEIENDSKGIQNQKDCFQYLVEKIVNKKEITISFILELHRQLMKGCYDETRYQKGERPGTFKIHDYVTGDGIGASPEDVENELQSLLEEVKEAEGKDVMTIAAYLHLRFEEIHPFADGNGRVGRTLLNYYLMTHGYPPVVLYAEDKKTYYLALTVFDKTGEVNGFLEFLKEQMVKTWSKKKKASVTLNMFL